MESHPGRYAELVDRSTKVKCLAFEEIERDLHRYGQWSNGWTYIVCSTNHYCIPDEYREVEHTASNCAHVEKQEMEVEILAQ